MKKALPERGKFQQAVLRAGQLLQTVMSAGSPPSRHPQVPSAAINPDLLRKRRMEEGRRSHQGWCRMKPAAPLRTLPSTQMSSLPDE
ncbi:hypothetical protein C4D60_Mb07t14140 [Musa balbisiana]|uniref:Uncharacterized protein n=1 Tax=Musa balbisiana TaxID=52838 RepID=A0A4S8JF71_MUSBA|nr:hypothetical protein C4D60_Mb07t14140 [Musa balbisiana]